MMIDYQQLGLDYKLYSCEVLFNRGLCNIYLAKETEGLDDFEVAQKEKQTPDHDIIDQVLEQGAENLSVFAVPPGILYRPPKSKIKNAKKVDYLGSSKLIAAVDKNEMFTGFRGAFLRKVKLIYTGTDRFFLAFSLNLTLPFSYSKHKDPMKRFRRYPRRLCSGQQRSRDRRARIHTPITNSHGEPHLPILRRIPTHPIRRTVPETELVVSPSGAERRMPDRLEPMRGLPRDLR